MVAAVVDRVGPQSQPGLGIGRGVAGDSTTASLEHIHWGELKPGRPIARGESLFPRIDKAEYLKDARGGKEARMDAAETTTGAPAPGPDAPPAPDAAAPAGTAGGAEARARHLGARGP